MCYRSSCLLRVILHVCQDQTKTLLSLLKLRPRPQVYTQEFNVAVYNNNNNNNPICKAPECQKTSVATFNWICFICRTLLLDRWQFLKRHLKLPWNFWQKTPRSLYCLAIGFTKWLQDYIVVMLLLFVSYFVYIIYLYMLLHDSVVFCAALHLTASMLTVVES